MDNRLNAAERFIDERQYEAMRVLARARLQREATQATWEGEGRTGGFARLAQAFRRALNHSLRSGSGRALQRDVSPVPVRVEIRRS